MNKYIRAELSLIEFESKDVVATSYTSDDDTVRERNNPVYDSGGDLTGGNWLEWLS